MGLPWREIYAEGEKFTCFICMSKKNGAGREIHAADAREPVVALAVHSRPMALISPSLPPSLSPSLPDRARTRLLYEGAHTNVLASTRGESERYVCRGS